MAEEDKSLSDIIKKVQKNTIDSIEKATSGGTLKVDLDKTISLSDLMGDVSGDNDDFSDRFDAIKKNILISIRKATSGGKLKVKLEKTIGLSDLLGDTAGDNDDFSGRFDAIKVSILNSITKATSGGNLEVEIDKKMSLSDLMGDTKKLDSLNLVLAYQFLKVKKNILNSIEAGTKSIGKVKFESLSLSSILGESPNLNLIHALRWLRIKKNILKKIEGELENVEVKIDNKMSLSSVLGSTPNQDIITRTRFFLIRQGLLSKISRAAEDFDPQQSIDSMTGTLGGAGGASGGAGGASGGAGGAGGASGGAGGNVSNGEIPTLLESISANIVELWSDISEPIISSSEFLRTLVENSSGSTSQETERRKEDIVREERKIQALNSISDNSTSNVESSKSSGGGIGGGIAGIGKGAGKGISGFLTGLGRGLKSISNPKFLIGAGVLVALGGALFVTGKALRQFTGIDFKQVALGVTTLGVLGAGAALLGKLGPKILIGSLAIGALGASLIPAAFAFSMFSDVNWKNVAIGIGTLTALGAAAFGLSFISPAIFIGAAAIGALGAAMIPAAFAFSLFGKALSTLTPFIEGFGNAISTVIGSVGSFLTGFIDSLIQLSGSGLGLITAGTGIAAVSAALIAFGSSSAIGGLLSFFGGDPIEKFLELADKSSGLDMAAKAIDSIGLSLGKLDSDKMDDMTDSLKGFVAQLKNLSKLELKEATVLFKSMSMATVNSVPQSRNNTGAEMEVGMSNIAVANSQPAPVIVSGGGGGGAGQSSTVNAPSVTFNGSGHSDESGILTRPSFAYDF